MALSSHMGGRTARRAARGDAVRALGRVGFVARGIIYLLIAWITLLIALQHSSAQADRSGALELVAGKPFGAVLLWFLVVGFGGLALWWLAQTLFPGRPEARRATGRAAAAFRVVLYGAACASTFAFVRQGKAGKSTDQQSRDFTARAMAHGGGSVLVGLVGVALIIGGLALVWRGVSRSFAKDLELSAMTARKRRWVLAFGLIGNCARGIVLAAAGWFMLYAAATFDPARAKGVDSTLRTFAAASYGPVLLVLMALGLAAFGLFSWGEARWRRL